ncbi:uncharacterized protein TEOVI_000788000 [Trypanosoma equiperdum]|uniref:Trypanosome variant surface glycoprotein (A-type) n=1 Tax=Trypanosoma equiperdum TaxID=5694 RepID=A0A1G4HZ42_TRYEQ|nr:hypothetical protein TEOVI_000788000 [Trypanosoma equiperdum]
MWTIRDGLLVIATTATVAQPFEPPKQISNPCDSTEQLLYLKNQLLAKATTNAGQITTAILKVAQLQAAAATDGSESVMFGALAAGLGAKVVQAQTAHESNVRKLEDAAAAAQELAGLQALIADVEGLSIKPMAPKQLGVSGPDEGKHYIRFASTGTTYAKCEPQHAEPDSRQAAQQADANNNVLDIFFLTGRQSSGTNDKKALLCFHSTNTAGCTAASANQNTYGELTAGNPLEVKKAQAKTPKNGQQKFTVTDADATGLLPRQNMSRSGWNR